MARLISEESVHYVIRKRNGEKQSSVTAAGLRKLRPICILQTEGHGLVEVCSESKEPIRCLRVSFCTRPLLRARAQSSRLAVVARLEKVSTALQKNGFHAHF